MLLLSNVSHRGIFAGACICVIALAAQPETVAAYSHTVSSTHLIAKGAQRSTESGAQLPFRRHSISQRPLVVLQPSTIVVGDGTMLTGSSFTPQTSVSITINAHFLARTHTSAAGTFRLSIKTNIPTGHYMVGANGAKGESGKASLIILSTKVRTGRPTPVMKPVMTSSPSRSPIQVTPTPTSLPPTPPPSPTPAPSSAIPVPTQTALPPVDASTAPNTGTTSNGCHITVQQTVDEQAVLSLLNKDRAAAGVASLSLVETISAVSRAHSCDMSQQNALNHNGPNETTFSQRIASLGISFSTAGENIGMAGGYGIGNGVNEGVAVIDNEMIAEPLTQGDHHWNIVNAAYHQVGVGVIEVNNIVWVTEDFIG